MSIFYTIPGIRKLTLLLENFLFNMIYKERLGNKVEIFGFPLISYQKKPNFKFGKRVRLISSSYFSPMGTNHPVIIRLLRDEAELYIGDNVGINGGAINVMSKITIGNNVMIGNNALISDTDFHPINPENRRYNRKDVASSPVIIENNVFIGKDSNILKGVRIGENSVVGAASVVVKDIPANEIWGGNPAKFLRRL